MHTVPFLPLNSIFALSHSLNHFGSLNTQKSFSIKFALLLTVIACQVILQSSTLFLISL